jgi:Fur family ferric uptake transcriptional regulator
MQRMTSQRRVIKDVFERVGQPMNAQEALAEAQHELPSLGIATVYRAINDLVDENWLIPVELPGEPARYERSNIGHHHHFQCRDCGRVFDVEGCPGNLRGMVPKGFELRSHEIILYGRCQTCAEEN